MDLPAGWESLDDAAAEGFGRELGSEVGSGHILYGLQATAIARANGTDDVLYRLPDGRVAEVHLTYGSRERPPWPECDVYESFEDWARSAGGN